ncbi:MAG: helix-turn-helix domain-containing protein [Candidatus Thermoplasmatota archaeon]|jgi:predicted transcriptional regulator|nr:helix-turn-helix domain-containing protein [Candidatus Thermoplasmatota archaeon]
MVMRDIYIPDRRRSSVLGSLFDLNPAEVSTYRHLALSDEKTTREMGEFLGKDRSTAYRILEKLCARGIVTRETRYLPKGGYYHVYAAIDPRSLKEDLENNIRKWLGNIFDRLNRADADGDLLQALTGPGMAVALRPPKAGAVPPPREEIPPEAGGGPDEKDEDEGEEKEEEDEEYQIPIHLR